MSIERRDTNGNYEPSNCYWATSVEQNSNTRRNNLITLNGATKTLSEWCRTYGFTPQTIGKRLKRGMSAEDAFELRNCSHGIPSIKECQQCESEIKVTKC
jgi:hypothetical protein